MCELFQFLMRPLLNAYRFVSLLSIDVAAGAAVGAAFFARILQVSLYPQAYVVLALTVWIIYTSDHLLDARRMKTPASTRRHLLHQQYFRLLTMLVIVAGLTSLLLVFFIRSQLMIPGVVMAVFCGFYLVLNRWLKFAKELMATILYSGGVLLPALSLSQGITQQQLFLIIQFVLLVMINLLLFARMGYHDDLIDRQQSFVTSAGLRASQVLIALLFVGFGLTSALGMSSSYVAEKIILILMAVVLLLIFLFPKFFALEERYRFVGDSIFLLPVIVLTFC